MKINLTDDTEKRRAEKIARYRMVFSARMLPALAVSIARGQAVVEVPLPPFSGTKKAPGFKVGDRLFYREWQGGPTGRAELLTILEFTREGNAAMVWRSFAWSRGKETDDLSELSLRVDLDFMVDGTGGPTPPLVPSLEPTP